MSGTVTVTSVGMFSGGGGGFAVGPPDIHNLMITVGGIAHRDGREWLSVTCSFNHDVVDGAPATRFARRLKDLVESASLLDEYVGDEEAAADEMGEAVEARQEQTAKATARRRSRPPVRKRAPPS